MEDRHGKSCLVVPVSCGLFMAIEIGDSITERAAMAEFYKAQSTVLSIAIVPAIPGLLALLFLA